MPDCRQTKEREIQTKRGPCLMETCHIGDTVEPFFFGDYWFEEEWYCVDCLKRAKEKDETAEIDWHKVYVRCINGEVRLWVNGEEVSGGSGCDPASGYLCLESEGSPVEFRQLRLRELP